ncbi:MAG: helix-turn-helix domain-containing protein [Spirochaetia bacterium]|nr:helix-turn-helix domain-containing protein [Spirochaetia bacterium]
MDYHIRTPQQLGAALSSHRKTLHLSQQETAEKIGLLAKTISKLENDPASSSIESMLKLISALGLSLTLSPEHTTDDQEW